MAVTNRAVRDALEEAAEHALRAPSILNTQPWRWRVTDGALLLYADQTRRVASIDPDGRLLTLSCGAALHHARAALAASGHEVRVDRFPEATNADLLARIRTVGQREPTREDVDVLRSIHRRRTDRRPIAAATPVPEEVQADLRRFAEREHSWLYHLGADQVTFLSTAATSAAAIEGRAEDYRAELESWVRRQRSTGEGIPADTVTAQVSRPVRLRDFDPGSETLLRPGAGDDTYATYFIVTTAADDPAEWLRAGEATSAVWLAATRAGLAMSAMSDVVEVPGARALLRSLLDPPGYPQLALRTGLDLQPELPGTTPRRRPEDVIETDA